MYKGVRVDIIEGCRINVIVGSKKRIMNHFDIQGEGERLYQELSILIGV